MKIIKIENQSGRIDINLSDEFPNLTRTTIKKLILDGLIVVNDQKVMPNYSVHKGDEIKIDTNAIRTFVKSGDADVNRIKPRNMNLQVIYEDENILVVNKPSGIQSHPVLRNDQSSLLSGLYYHVANQEKFDKDIKIRLVHRLDKETSGVILAAKNLEAHEFYSKQFETRTVTKEYVAVVHGDFSYKVNEKKKSMIISTYISRSNQDDKKYINTSAKKGKSAVSEVFFIDHFNKFGKKKFSVVKIVPQTGRTHQIRVHLSSIGYPILGDKLYGGQKYRRMMLHAFSLTIPMFRTRDEIVLTAELPKEFKD